MCYLNPTCLLKGIYGYPFLPWTLQRDCSGPCLRMRISKFQNLQIVAGLISCIVSAAVQITNDSTIIYRATTCGTLLKTARTYSRKCCILAYSWLRVYRGYCSLQGQSSNLGQDSKVKVTYSSNNLTSSHWIGRCWSLLVRGNRLQQDEDLEVVIHP
jgi:hypothetical protein